MTIRFFIVTYFRGTKFSRFSKNREIKEPLKRIFDVFNVFLTFLTYFLAKSRKLSPAKYARSIFEKLSSRENK